MGSVRTVVATIYLTAVLYSFVQSGRATTWVVDESGSGNFTSLDAVTSSKVKAGDTLYLRGKFTKMNTLQNLHGTEDLPITLTSYPGTRAIFDGSGVTLSSYQGIVRLNIVSYIILDNILARNCSQAGISLYYADNTTVKNCEVHDTYVRAIGGCGNNVVIRNNTVYNAVMQNYANSSSSWSQAVSCSSCETNKTISNWVFEYNKVYNSWGEGIDATTVDGCIIRHNEVYDAYSVLIYLDNARNCLVESNYVHHVDPRYNNQWGPAAGIVVGAENWAAVPMPSFNITIQNNLIIGSRVGISGYPVSPNYVNNVKIYYNTVWYTKAVNTFSWPAESWITQSGNELVNNIFYAPSASVACNIAGQLDSWTISNNVFVGMSSVPTACSDTGSVNSSIAVANTSLIHFASADPSTLKDFLLSSSSPARGAGVPLSGVSGDYFGYTRDTSSPSAGFAEYGTSGGDDGSSASAISGFIVAVLRTTLY